METLRSKRNAVLKSAIMEQVQIPLLSARDSQTSEVESSQMEVESDHVGSQVLSQQFSQSQAPVVQNDQEQVDRIDFSSLGDHAVVGDGRVCEVGFERERLQQSR